MELNETYTRIGDYIESHPSDTYAEIAAALRLSRAAVARIARLQGIKRRPGKRAALEAAVARIDAANSLTRNLSGGGPQVPPEQLPPAGHAASVSPDELAGSAPEAGPPLQACEVSGATEELAEHSVPVSMTGQVPAIAETGGTG